MKQLASKIIFALISIGLILLPLIISRVSNYTSILPAFEIIILFYLLWQKETITILIIIFISSIFIDLIYDFPICTNITMGFVGYYIKFFLEKKGYLFSSRFSITIISRFAVFAFLLLTLRYLILSIYSQYLFNYGICMVQCLMTICHYPIMHLIFSKIKQK